MSRAVLLVIAGDTYGLSRTALDAAQGALRVVSSPRDVEIWSATDGPLLELARARGFTARVVDMPVLRRSTMRGRRLPGAVLRLGGDALRFWRTARREGRDITLVHAFGAPNLGGVVLARAVSRPLVWSVHEVFSSKAEIALFRRLLRVADVRLACSHYVADQLGTPGAPFQVVHSGTDVAEVGGPLLERATAGVICVGRLNRWKGQDVLLKAISRLPEELRSRCEVELVGSAFESEPEVAAELKALCSALDLDDRVTFLGERSDARTLMARADVVVVPSKKPEPFGMVVIEAMALGRAVIATTPGGPAEVITDGVDGCTVPIGDIGSLTAALAGLLQDPVRARSLGRKAAITARRFSGASAAEGYGSAYVAATKEHVA